MATIQRWPSKNELLQAFHVTKQTAITKDAYKCFFGEAPALNTLNAIYGNGTAEEWLTYQLAELSEFSGARDKITQGQLRQSVNLILGEYGNLTLAEFMLFCRRMKLGRYKSFYGSVDPMAIMRSLVTFMSERNEARAEHEAAHTKRCIEEEKGKTYLDYTEFKLIQYAEAEYAMNTRDEDEKIELKYKLKKRRL